MNQIWSKRIQGVHTLYLSRKLRFADRFEEQYRTLFDLEREKPLNILEIGCGPGALAGALHRWYPGAEITALDRDSDFIQFARDREPGICFLEGDAQRLPFGDAFFDVTVSNTVSEHIAPEFFFGEQYRVLKPGGICLVLSARRGNAVQAECLAPDEWERQFWEKAGRYDRTFEAYGVGRYAMNEAELPLAMERYGFVDLRSDFVVSSFAPDHPDTSPEEAEAMVRADLWNDLEAAESVLSSIPEHFSREEVDRMKERITEKYEKRLALYRQGRRQYDCRLTVTQVVRGVKG